MKSERALVLLRLIFVFWVPIVVDIQTVSIMVASAIDRLRRRTQSRLKADGNLMSRIRNKPVQSFLILAFSISWIIWILAAIIAGSGAMGETEARALVITVRLHSFRNRFSFSSILLIVLLRASRKSVTSF